MKYRNILVNQSDYLFLKNNHLCFKKEGGFVEEIFINEINTVIFNNPFTTVTTQLLAKLIEENVTIIHCNIKRIPIGISNKYYSQNQNYNNLQNQINWSPIFTKNLWKKVIQNKINNQLLVLEYVTNNNYILNKVKEYKNTVLSGDKSNREAVVAKLFFNTLYGDMYRRFDDDIINAAQNYGYKIIVSKIVTELSKHGLIPFLGFHHIGKSNNLNLAYDLIEPFRPIVDYFIWVNLDDFSEILNYEMKKNIIELTTKSVLYDKKIFSLQTCIQVFIKDFMTISNEQNFEYYKNIDFVDIYEQ